MENPFKWLGALFSSALAPAGTESVLGVDVGSAYLKLVQLRRKSGTAVLETYGELALGPYGGTDIGRATHLPPEKLAEALRDLMREAHVTTTSAALAIPFSSSLVTTMEIPALPEKELATAVPIEARKFIPVPISEVNLDWWIVPEEPRAVFSEEKSEADAPNTTFSAEKVVLGKQKILIAAIHNEALSRFDAVAKQAGITSSFFEIELFATIRALFPQDLAAHAVLDLGAGETKLYIIDRGLLRLSHIMSSGAQDLTLALSRALNLPVAEAEKLKRSSGLLEAGTAAPARAPRAGAQSDASAVAPSLCGLLDAVFAEANRSFQHFASRFGHPVADLTLSGGGANMPGLAAFAEKACIVPVSLANPFSHVEAPAFLDEVLKGVGPEFSVALGVAFRKLQEAS